MTRSPSKSLLPLVFLLCLIPSSFSIILIDWLVLVENGSPNVNLATHCYSDGEDMGVTTLAPGQQQHFTCGVILKHRSVATCEMTLGNAHGAFDLFDWDRDKAKYTELANMSIWKADDRGLFLYLEGGYVFQFPWWS